MGALELVLWWRRGFSRACAYLALIALEDDFMVNLLNYINFMCFMANLEFKINGRRFIINDLDYLLNDDFISYYPSIFGSPIFNINQFKQNSKTYFTTVNGASEKWSKHDLYFNNLTIIWGEFINKQKYKEAEEVWKVALDIAKEWEEENSKFIHKGTPYYFWAVTCFLEEDIERGFILMNQAHLADKETQEQLGRDGNPNNLPAGLFLFFNPADNAQFLKPKLDEIKLFLEGEIIRKYSSTRHRTFTYTDFENKFLKNNLIRTDMKFHFNLNLFKLEKLLNRNPPIKGKNTILSLIYLEIIFDLCRVLDLIINQNQNFKQAIIDFAKRYKPNDQTQNPAFDNINSQDFNTTNFLNNILQHILDSNYQIGRYSPDDIEKDIIISYGFRNLGAHEIVGNGFIVDNFPSLVQRILNSIFLAVELYY